MVPLEGKAVVAYWDERADQLVLYTSTQVPHMIRIGLAETLGLSEGRIRVIAPDVGGGFGYKCVLHPEEICIAWLALTYRRPFRYIEDRREHLVAGANARQHHYKLKGYADARVGGQGTRVRLVVDYSLQGPLAQFSRTGLAQELARGLIAEFAANLERGLARNAPLAPASTTPLNVGALLWRTFRGWLRWLFDRA
jgi:CO/xanthine dehydrogenase Mo-binding subunit